MKPRILLSIISILVIYGGINFYLGWNGWLFLSELTDQISLLYYSLFIIFVAMAYIIGQLGYFAQLRFIAEPIKWIGSYWFAIIQYGLLLLPIANLTALVLEWSGLSTSAAILGVGTCVLLVLLLILALGSWNAWRPVIRRYDITVEKEAGEGQSLKPLRIAMASDLHLGTAIGKRHLLRLVSKVNEIKPDIILLPGDILDDDIAPFIRKKMSEQLGMLHAPLGVYAVTGNHEYIGRKVPQFVEAMSAIDIHVLMDETVTIDNRFIIVGRKDKASSGFGANGRKSIPDLLSSLDKQLPIIMMDHQPSDLLIASQHGIDLSLSGHTHRGQMFPNHLITRRIFPLDWGYKKFGNLHAIVSSGFGFWGPPIRIGSRSEVIHIEMRTNP